MEENKDINKELNSDIPNLDEPLVYLPTDIHVEGKDFFKRLFKTFLPYTLICIFATLITFSSFLFCLLYNKVGFSIYIFSLVLFIILFIFLLFPSIYNFIKIIILQSMQESEEFNEGKPHKDLEFNKLFFNDFYGCYKKIFFRTHNILVIFLKTLLFFIIFSILILSISSIIRTQFDHTLNDELNNLLSLFRLGNFNSIIDSIKDLLPSFKIELIIINGLTSLLFIHLMLWNNYYISYTLSTILIDNQDNIMNKKIRTMYKNCFKKYRWEFITYYWYNFKFLYIGFTILFIGLNILGYFLFNNALLITTFSTLISTFIFSFFNLYFYKTISDITYSFNDLFFKIMIEETKSQMKKISKLINSKEIEIKASKNIENKDGTSEHKEKEINSEGDLLEFLKSLDNLADDSSYRKKTRRELFKEYKRLNKKSKK